MSLAEIVDAGARRVSVGGGFTWIAVSAMVDAARAVREAGDFASLAAKLPLDDWLTE
jgi:2-methylisocitrate lyase-like PEP mutase family enzyme